MIGQRLGFTIDLSKKQNSAPTSDIKNVLWLKGLIKNSPFW